MSIQSNINATIGAFGAIKKAHDLGIAKQAQQRMEEQKQAITKQRLNIQEYREKTKRKRLNLEIKQLKEQKKETKENGEK